ncbi:anti-phage defense-associated sirtuin Dsr1 [Vibrio splendidus]|uniref:anti-phage defense-associated sirtuin Dsr1 n=1 Tax=Vibrio splendidus TaxID=29497 RepID=UPI002117DBC5|nr:anti-phage defense-associated sirtuin Dsr1 [Vibrio splendidus]MCQ8866758.1 SIR2 family protein [Vibrio splendidus]
MQFIKDGPDIPDALLQAHEEGNVVFFCGAGISYPAGLPGFKGLVDKIYADIGETPNHLESNVYDKGLFDSTLDLLERRVAGERQTVRKALLTSLKPNYRKKNALLTHESLLKLACDNKGMTRLVTTNFDRVFEKVIKRKKLKTESFIAPFLPIPKKSRWDGLVYLHGLVPEKPDFAALNRLVFTSGDFGLAYLTERWASRFVGELFRSYVICFVGYSINDPVLRYMMDALAADRMLGEVVPEAYAFGDFELGKEKVVKDEWQAKGVTPILYPVEAESHDHSKLHNTLEIWSNTYSEGALGKESIVARHAIFPPTESTKEDDYVGRVLWALSEPSGTPAKRFAELNPCPPINWLEKLSERRFSLKDLPRFGIFETNGHREDLAFSLIERPAPSSMSDLLSVRVLSYRGYHSDSIMFQISRWLLRHLNDPTVVFWLTSYNGQLSENFRRLLESKFTELQNLSFEKKAKILEDSPNAIPDDEMMTLWQMLLANRVMSSTNDRSIFNWLDRVNQDGFNTSSRIELRELLAPKIRIRKPFIRSKRYEWELTLSGEHLSHYLNDIKTSIGEEGLGKIFEDLQMLLMDALDLAKEMSREDDWSDRSHWDLPSISKHPQNRGFHDWVNLIELLRDSWLQILSNDIPLASALAKSWFDKPYPVFKRLALFAARHDSVVESQLWCDWLCQDDGWWLWSTETQRETMRLLVLQGKSLDRESQVLLEKAILEGLPRRMFRKDLEEAAFNDMNEHSVWLNLAKLQEGGVLLSDEVSSHYLDLSKANPEWKLNTKYEKDEFSHWMSGTGDPDYEDSRIYELAPTEKLELTKWLMESTPERAFRNEDNWKDVCRENIELAVEALNSLLTDNLFPAKRWNTAIWAWSEDKVANESWKMAAHMVSGFSDEQINECLHPIARWLQSISKNIDAQRNEFVLLVDKVLSIYAMKEEVGNNQLINITDAINHPVGVAMEALFNYWFTTGLKDNDGLKGHFHKIFSKVCSEPSDIFNHGKLIIASQMIALYRVDPEWTKSNLIPLFDWKTDERMASIVWNGFLWAPRIYLPLIENIKKTFLDTSSYLSLLEGGDRQYIQLFIYTALEQSSILSEDEVRKVLKDIPVSSLGVATNILSQALNASEHKEEYWVNRIYPIWKNSWPKSKDRMSESVVEALVMICIDSGEHFPEALTALKGYFGKIKHPDYSISKLLSSDIGQKFPRETIELLDKIVDRRGHPPHRLGELLLLAQDASLNHDATSKFIRLMEFADSRGR